MSPLLPRDAFAGLLLILGIAAAAAPGRACAAVVKDISTGIDPATGAKLENLAFQDTYAIAPGGTGGQVGVPVRVWSDDFIFSGCPGTYLPDAASPKSSWVAVYPNSPNGFGTGLGTYLYQTTVDLTGFDPATAVIAPARFAVDDVFRGVQVNEVPVFNSPPAGYFNSDRFLDLPAGLGAGAFRPGMNTITFVVENVVEASPASFRFEGSVTATPVPEPGAAVGLTTIIATAALLRRSGRVSRELISPRREDLG